MESTEILKKPYARLVMPDEDGTFTAEIVEFPGCIVSGRDVAEALHNLDETAADWIAAAREQGQDIPEPLEAAGYSGKLVVRMAKNLHKRAALCAERDGVSLNQFIVNCIADQVGLRTRPAFVHAAQVRTVDTTVLYPPASGRFISTPTTVQSCHPETFGKSWTDWGLGKPEERANA